MSLRNINSVFYAQSYHPIQAGSIDGTDILPHDNAVWRAHLCSSAGLYDPFGDPKVIGDPYCTVFVGRLSHRTDEESLRKAMSRYGRVKNLRLVRHIVTGASRGYAFVEYETEREMRRAYEDAHHSLIDDSEVIVDYNRQQLMPGWIPRRLGGGLGGKKESGQLRFGGRERPFRAPLRIPYDELKRLGIPIPPEGRYMSRFQIPSPPRRSSSIGEGSPLRHRRSEDREEHSRRRSIREGSPPWHQRSEDSEEHSRHRSSHREDSPRRSKDREKPSRRSSKHVSREDSAPRHQRSEDSEGPFSRRSSHVTSEDSPPRHRRPEDKEEPSRRRSSHVSKEVISSRHRRSEDREEPRHRRRRSPSAVDESSHKRHRHRSDHSHRDEKGDTTR